LKFKHVITSESLKEKPLYPTGDDPKALVRIGKAFSDLLMDTYEGREVWLLCTGSSGAMLAGIIAVHHPKLKRIVYIRKDHESHHEQDSDFWLRLLTNNPDKSIVFIDDVLLTGSTIIRVLEKIKSVNSCLVPDAIMVSGKVHSRELMKYDFPIVDTLFCHDTDAFFPNYF
jgi:orotate phosphoribosyltransferase-like protein